MWGKHVGSTSKYPVWISNIFKTSLTPLCIQRMLPLVVDLAAKYWCIDFHFVYSVKNSDFSHTLNLWPGLALQHLSAEVCGPSGTTEEATVTITGCDLCSVSFVPTEPGVHTVSVQYKGQPIPGALYQYTVGPLGEGGAEKVQAWGPGLGCAKTNIPGKVGNTVFGLSNADIQLCINQTLINKSIFSSQLLNYY